MNERTLCFPIRANPAHEVLLGLKKTGFGAGKYAGFGGKLESGETILQAAARELEEEAGLRVALSNLRPAGALAFLFPNRPAWDQKVHLFVTHTWEGDPAESAEMRPLWCSTAALPFAQMWDDARYWLARVLAGETFHAVIVYHADNQTVAAVRETSAQDGGPGA